MNDGGGAQQRPLRVAVLGCGVVGSQVVRLVLDQAGDLAARVGRPVELAGVAVRRIDAAREIEVPDGLLTTDAAGLVAREDVDLVVEVIGGIEPARTLILSALEHGASGVSANKALLAEDGPTLFEMAAKAGRDIFYEAAVAGAIPILRPLSESLAGDRVTRVLGIVNGTTNYILDKMDTSGAGFAEALAEAQDLGYAEADPTADVEGFDAAGELMFYGPGAGGAPTASAVMGDLVTAARNHVAGTRGAGESAYADRAVLPMGETRTRYHVAIDVDDRAGVLATVALAFAEHGVSIQTVRQEGRDDDAQLVVVSHWATDAQLSATVEHLRGLEIVREVTSVMRVEGGDE